MPFLFRLGRPCLSVFALFFMAPAAHAEDWPMWRYDSGHTAASPEQLPRELSLQWVRHLPQREQAWDDPLNNDLMQYDKIFEPVVMGQRMFVGFNDSDKVIALDIETGEELWSVYTNGPVRFSPVGWEGKVYFASDDGYLYCVNAEDGTLVWKFRGGPSELKVIGNKRVVSAWPARGGPVLRDGHVYFAASIWPFMGTFIYSLDAESGEVDWVNDGTGAQYILQPHGAASFAGVAPQGTLVATEDVLLVPSGRAVPAAFDRRTGKFLYYHHGGKGYGGSFVAANESEFFIHTRLRGVLACELKKGGFTKFTCNEPVLAGDFIYTADQLDEDEGGDQMVRVFGPKKKFIGQIEADASGDLIKAGSRLYAAGADAIVAIEPSKKTGQPEICWSHSVDGEILRLLAANGKLFAVTLDGRILAFGAGTTETRHHRDSITAIQPTAAHAKTADTILKLSDAASGYALVYGVDDGQLLDALLSESKLRIVAVDPDAEKIERLRRHYDAAGIYGERVTLHEGDPLSFKAPPYIAELVVVEKSLAEQYTDSNTLRTLYESVRPYGGALWLPMAGRKASQLVTHVEEMNLPRAEMLSSRSGVLVLREGALPGSADWTHQYGDVANTVKSNDRRVKFPLGLLWFGGNSNLDVLPRHGHGPTEQVVGGRLFVEGMDGLSARDVYTGRVIWKFTSEDMGTFGMYFNESYKDTPLSTERNQQHLPGANARGTNFVATEDVVYLLLGSECHVLDAKTGTLTRVIRMPKRNSKDERPQWGFLGVYEDVLLGGWGFAKLDQKAGRKMEEGRLSFTDMSGSSGLVAFDRHTGRLLWKTDANNSFLHNGIVAGDGRIYCLDRLPTGVEAKLHRRGIGDPSTYRIVAFDAKNGSTVWEQSEHIFGTWLSYSKKHGLLLQAGAKAPDRQEDAEIGQGMATFRVRDGSLVWKHNLKYSGPCILHNDIIITNVIRYSISSGAFNLVDGSPHLITNPLTGEEEPWRITRTYGCDSMTACENFLTFRSGSAGYYDLATKSGTGNLGGFKSSCSGNLVVANGVLNAPDYTRTCSCSYQNQTSLALIHMPEIEMWANNEYSAGAKAGTRVGQIGINFGAPGDRRTDDGTLWVDYPSVGGKSPDVAVKVAGDKVSYYRRHSSAVNGEGQPWITASGVNGAQQIAIHLRTPDKSATPPHEGIAVLNPDDDGEENADGSISLDGTELEFGTGGKHRLVGLRFRNIQIERGQEIAEAAIQFKADERSYAETELVVRAQADDDAPEFRETNFNLSSRPMTSESVVWVPEGWSKAGRSRGEQRTPDLKKIIQELVNRDGWKSGNAMAFTLEGRTQRIAESFVFAVDGNRTVESFDGNPGGAPTLYIKTKAQVEKEKAKKKAKEAKEKAEKAARAKAKKEGRKYVKEEDNKPQEPLFPLTESAEKPTQPHTVRLHFAELDGLDTGDRVFHIFLQGERVLEDFDVVADAGGQDRGIVKEFSGVPVADTLHVFLQPANDETAAPILAGIEIIAETP